MFKFGTSDRKKSLKVKTLKPTTKVVATSDSSHPDEEIFIKRISYVSREGFFREDYLYPEVDYDGEDKPDYTYQTSDIFYEISFVDGFRFSCRCAEGELRFYDIMDESYVSLSSTGKFICTGGPSALVELCNHIRNKVPIFGTFATGFDGRGVRCLFNNAYSAIFLNGDDFVASPISESHRVIDASGVKSGKPWYFLNHAVRWC